MDPVEFLVDGLPVAGTHLGLSLRLRGIKVEAVGMAFELKRGQRATLYRPRADPVVVERVWVRPKHRLRQSG